MRDEIEKFCDDIKVEYCLYMYVKDSRFPYCCKLSADLITSFLKIVCSDNFQYICTTKECVYNHAWTYYKDEVEEFIIDFANIQFKNSKLSYTIKIKDISIEEFKKVIYEETVVFNPQETYMYGMYDEMIPKKQNCYGIIDNFTGGLNKNDFMKFLEKSYDVAYNNTSYKYNKKKD